MKPDEVAQNNQTATRFPNRSRGIDSWRRILTWAGRGSVDGQGARVACRSPTDRARRHARREDPALKSCGRGSLAAISSVSVSKLYADCCAPIKAWTGKLTKGIVGNSAISVHNDREGRQQETFELSTKLVVLRFPLGHESSKTPKFSTEWMVNKEKQAVQKLRGQYRHLSRGLSLRLKRPGS